MNRETRSTDTQSSILDAAVDLFIAQGFESTPMDAIANAAGVAKGTLYYHFDSKEGIVDAIVARYAEEGEAGLAEIASGSAPFVDKLEAVAAVLGELNNRHFSRLHRMKYIDIHTKTNTVMVKRFARHIARIVEQGVRDGVCSCASPIGLVEVLLAAAGTLLDPDAGEEEIPRRRESLAGVAALGLDIDIEAARRMFPEEGLR
jgi:AcrR family transcriptional regulator